ncbi:hypothetical protein [Fulvivirga ligni]|nr:hypothetical protein [Fulvivirga ligni]UII19857.1 hypothetical protein LVD16_18605 [Fulvivirga ligni]
MFRVQATWRADMPHYPPDMTNILASAIAIYVAFAFVGVSICETSDLCG